LEQLRYASDAPDNKPSCYGNWNRSYRYRGFGSYYFGGIEDTERQRVSEGIQSNLRAQITALQRDFDSRTELIFQALGIKQDIWITVEMRNVPSGVADYLLLLFKSDKGRISGKVRIKGSESISYFSTTANSTIPVAVPNLWLPKDDSYQVPTILEFAVVQKTDSHSTLSVYTAGWIDTRGREPH
jgi:hypothetical protein